MSFNSVNVKGKKGKDTLFAREARRAADPVRTTRGGRLFGPLYVGHLNDQYPDRPVIYCFLIGILILGLGYVFTYLLNDDRLRVEKPTVEDTLRQFGIAPPRGST